MINRIICAKLLWKYLLLPFWNDKLNFTTVNIKDRNRDKLMSQDYLSSWLPKSCFSSTLLEVCSLFCALCTTALNSTRVSNDMPAKSWTLGKHISLVKPAFSVSRNKAMKLTIHLINVYIRFIRLIIRLKFTTMFKNTWKARLNSRF